LLIFVFERVSCGRQVAILAEFGPVPNAPSDVDAFPQTRTFAGAAPTPPVPRPTVVPAAVEFGGPQGPEPTRFGDWEKNGRCIDF
jgi:Protein of unknown function (DUF1674)